MTKQRRGSKSPGRRGDPNQDVQPWLGWVAALLVVVIVVVAVAMGMARTNEQRGGVAEVRMTPLVGGIEVPVATETSAQVAASEVTPIPDSGTISQSSEISMVTVITTTESITPADTFTLTGDMTPTTTISGGAPISGTAPVTGTEAVTGTAPVSETGEISTTGATTATAEMTPGSTPEVTATEVVSAPVNETPAAEATGEAETPGAAATGAPTRAATATPRPTARATVANAPASFEVGTQLTAREGRVELHADAAVDAMILDTVGPGVELEVIPPSGDYPQYPVEVDGVNWVRVRSADGLVGWVRTDQVEAE